MEADGSFTVLANRCNNQRLNRPNDVVGKSDGSLYFRACLKSGRCGKMLAL
jgi:sugar lactone lactonase YvrE